MTQYECNTEEELAEAMKNTKPGSGDIFICNDATFENIHKYANTAPEKPTVHRFIMEDMLKSKKISIDIRSDVLEDVDVPSIRWLMKKIKHSSGENGKGQKKPMMNEWISCKEELPPDNVRVMAKNPFIESESWLDGVDELGKRAWCHKGWEHADQFVTHWRHINNERGSNDGQT